MELWSVGVLEYWVAKAEKVLYSFKLITPVLHYSNWGEAPKFVFTLAIQAFMIFFKFLMNVEFSILE